MSLLKQPGWLRALEIVTGLLSIVAGAVVLGFPGLGVATLVILLSIGLLFMGIRSIALVGFRSISLGQKALSAISGIIALILAVLVVLFPGYGVLTLLTFVLFGLIVYGVGRIFLAYMLKATAGWIRGMIVATGVIAIILSVIVLLLPGLALLTFAAVLSVALLVSGVEMIVSGAIGRTWLGNLVKAAENEMKKS